MNLVEGKDMKNSSVKKIYIINILFFLIASISIIVSNVSYDAEYQMAMGYRLLKGDTPILEMWEPNQTSAFLCAIIMKLYISIAGTTTGIVLFVNVMGYLIRVGISGFLYYRINKMAGKVPALIACFLFILIGPKDMLVPDYSNMEVWFSTLTVLFLVEYFEKKKVWQLIMSAVSLCFGVISYPSYIIAYFAIIVLLVKYAPKKNRDIIIYTGTCAFLGICYVGYLLWGTDLETVMNCLSAALAIEPTHTISASEKIIIYVKNLGKIIGTVTGLCLAGAAAEFVTKTIQQKRTGDKVIFSKERCMVFSWYALLIFYVINVLRVISNGSNHYALIFIVLLGFCKRNLLSEEQKKVYYTGLSVGVMALLSTALLSDQPFLQHTPFMLIAVVISILPLSCWYKECKADNRLKKIYVLGVQLFLLVLVFRCVHTHIPIYGRAQVCSITQDLALIRTGPAIGIITDEIGAARQRDSYAEFQRYIKPGDTIWILGEPVDTMGYLYQDVEVGAPSVMSTPTYNEELLYYWELNPEKYPDVVIVSAGFGNLAYEMLACEWLMNWLEEEYQAETIIDGNWWRYYFKEAR